MKKLFFIFICYCLCPLSLAFSAQQWKEYRSRHFIIYYKNAPEDFIKTVEDSAEDYYDTVLKDLGFSRDSAWTWDKRAQIYIYDDENDYVATARQVPWSSGSTVLGSKVIQTYPAARGFFDSILPHELGHIIFREYVGFTSRIPLWVDEGVAMYQEKAKGWGADADVKEAISKGQFISLDDLTALRLTPNSSQETIMLFYAEAASAIHYLISEQGRFKFLTFCQNLRSGLSLNKALEKTYYRFKNVGDLNKAWVGYLSK